jgi:hypothetical protein
MLFTFSCIIIHADIDTFVIQLPFSSSSQAKSDEINIGHQLIETAQSVGGEDENKRKSAIFV